MLNNKFYLFIQIDFFVIPFYSFWLHLGNASRMYVSSEIPKLEKNAAI